MSRPELDLSAFDGHTDAPWTEVSQGRNGPLIAHRFDTGKQMTPTGLRLVSQVMERGDSLAQDKANARLIAAAPTLLAELRACRKQRDALAEALTQITMGNHPDYPHFRGGTEHDFAEHLIEVARAALQQSGLEP